MTFLMELIKGQKDILRDQSRVRTTFKMFCGPVRGQRDILHFLRDQSRVGWIFTGRVKVLKDIFDFLRDSIVGTNSERTIWSLEDISDFCGTKSGSG